LLRVASVALSLLYLGFGGTAPIGAERAPYVYLFLELSTFVAAQVTPVAFAWFQYCPFARLRFASWHKNYSPLPGIRASQLLPPYAAILVLGAERAKRGALMHLRFLVGPNSSVMTKLNVFFLMLFGPDGQPKEMTVLQISIRCIVVFAIGLALVRIGDRRSLSQKTGFDALFIVLLGSVLSRAINGSAPLWKTIGASVLLMIIHRLLAFGCCRSHGFGKLIKGRDVTLVRDGEIDWKAMNKSLVSQHDLEEDVRLEAKVEKFSKIRVARLERSGDISFIKSEGGS